MTETAIVVATVADAVYDRVRAAITSGAVRPGARISLRSIASAFSVSTMPVREALKRLQAEGLVVFERRSVTVVALSPEELGQVFQIRLRLEQLAAEWALKHLTAADVDDLRAVLTEMADEHLPAAQWRALNRRFHERFYACARSPHLLDLIHSTWSRVEPYMSIYASTVEDFGEAHRQHLAMLALIEARDLPGLLAETRWHLEHTSRTVARALSDAAENAVPSDLDGWPPPPA
ncbi:GntR family transcriptional regulator [Kineococcus rubinsiae]|uniref:GntR family transcriptional regulator n=1 Tax=Kineococcus rubinsiae TaxID=2609562 RepID=UPI00143084BC|nr:GntR family transcriptional regulator [Kineococcus rubinsiae]NIZ90930.1 GntR family transcriptional regulator [Kineococcus rubinsiae]